MLARIIFCVAVVLATLTVILLALISPVAHRKHSGVHSGPWIALSLYIQQPQSVSPQTPSTAEASSAGAFVFHHTLTEGPENTSRSVGKAQGFIVPIEEFAHSAFNVIYLKFNTPDYSGSLSVQANQVDSKESEGLTVVGGTGSFAFARGHAIFERTHPQIYHVKLHLKFPNRTPPSLPSPG